MKSQGARLRSLIEQSEILVMPGVWDGFSAKVAQQSGFKSAVVSGAALSESRLGRPDVGILGLAENVHTNQVLRACSDLLLLADADTGYGNAVNVHFTVKEFEAAGIAGVTIEDQVFPKRCGHMDGKEVIDADEATEKVRAAVEARVSSDFVIKARTDAARYLGVDEAIKRGRMFAAAGADLIMADAIMTVEDIALFARSMPAPISVNMGFGIRSRPTTPLLSAKQLQDLGVAVVSYPRLLSAAAVRGMLNAAAVLNSSLELGEVIERPELLVSFPELQELMGLPEILELEARYATGGPQEPGTEGRQA